MLLAGVKKEAELLFYHAIVEKIEKHSIPHSPFKTCPTTLAKRSTK